MYPLQVSNGLQVSLCRRRENQGLERCGLRIKLGKPGKMGDVPRLRETCMKVPESTVSERFFHIF
jgi:hypothetical protein